MDDRFALWDWRRRIADLYGAVRGNPDPHAAWELWHATRATLFATHPQSAIEADARPLYSGPQRFPYAPGLRFLVGLVPIDGTAPERMAAGDDGEVALLPFARTSGLHEPVGGELTLYWIAGYGGGVLLPFTDATNGSETYGGGRYLLDTIKGADLGTAPDGRVVVDFNFAYFPSCAYSSRYVCPMVPAANRLPTPIRAGERL